MRRFCWRERSEKLNWRLLGALDVAEVVRRGDPAALEPYALHVTFARLPRGAGESMDAATRDAWFLVRLMQLAMEYLLFVRARDGDVLEALGQELRQVEKERDELVLGVQRWKNRARSGDKQVDKLHQVLQNIAKLLQIHGASPSAVATIETLLTELISERRAKQKRRALEKEDDGEVEQVLRPTTVQEARVCGFCGKLFSSAEYLEKHLVRRHGGERIAVETPVKRTMRRDFRDEMEDKENRARNDDSAVAAVSMQKMVQQVERALHEHEEKLRVLAEEEAQKVQQVYEKLHSETKLAEELKVARLEAELQHKEVRRQLDEISLEKQDAEEKLADLKQQIQFLTLKKKMMGSSGSPATMPPNGGGALTAAKEEISKLQETLEVVSSELTSSREELAKVHSLYLSALRKKKELADKLALQREIPVVTVQNERSSQTEDPTAVNESVQTDDQARPLLVESEMLTEPSAPICVDMGTDPLLSICEDVGIQTVDVLETPLVDAEVQAETDASASAMTESRSQEALVTQADASEVVNEIMAVQEDEERLPDYIQQIHSQDLIERLTERAQSAASKVTSSGAPLDSASRNCSSIPRHKYVRSQFQHDEAVVKARVASCLVQLEQFSSRFGIPTKSVWLPEGNLQLVQQALHGHLEVLPNEVLAKMIECENTVNKVIETEWMPMEKARQQALERFKMEVRAKSEVSQGLVRQAMAAFGSSARATQATDISSSEAVPEQNSNEIISVENENEGKPGDLSSGNEDKHEIPVVTTARRFSAKNQLSVVVDGESTVEGTACLPDDFVQPKVSASGADATAAATGVEEEASPPEVRDAVDYLVESLHHDDEVAEKAKEPTLKACLASSLLPSHDTEDPRTPAANADDLPTASETRQPTEPPTNQMKSIRVDSMTENRTYPSPQTDARGERDLAESSPTSFEVHRVMSAQESTPDDGDDQDDFSRWQLPRIGSSSDLGAPQRISVHPALSRTRSDRFEAASSPQLTTSLESDRLSEVSQFEVIDPPARLDHTQSIMASSEMSFDTDIPSLGEEEGAYVEASTNAVVRRLVDAVEQRDERNGESAPAPVVSNSDRNAQNDSVMSFDDSDIEDVMLT